MITHRPEPDIDEAFTWWSELPAKWTSVGWKDSRVAPVLWSEWAHEGMLLRSTVFAHSPGAKALERGDEPLFLWMRFSIHKCLPALSLPPEYGFSLNLNAFYIKVGSMSIRYNLAVERESRRKPARTLLHIPPVEGLEHVVINGGSQEARPGEVVEMERPDHQKTLSL